MPTNPTPYELAEADACEPGLAFYIEHDCDPAALVPEHPDWYMWLADMCPGDWIDALLLDRCAAMDPLEALRHVADILSPERLSKCARRRPLDALNYASYAMSAADLDWCAEREPFYALRHHARRITPARLPRPRPSHHPYGPCARRLCVK